MKQNQDVPTTNRHFRSIKFHGDDGHELHATMLSSPLRSLKRAKRQTLVLFHGGGPDHHMLIPLANHMPAGWDIILPDIRGYGRSVCRDASRHSWGQYAADVIALLDHIDVRRAVVGGAGLGGTIALRVADRYPQRIRAAVVISLEAIESDAERIGEIRAMEAFAAQVRSDGIQAAWAPFLEQLPVVIGAMVRDAIPRSDPDSIAAAAAIAHDRSFGSADELAAIEAPTLIIPGIDSRHPTSLAEDVVEILPKGRLADVRMSHDMRSSSDFAEALAPSIIAFLKQIAEDPVQPRNGR